MKKSTKAFMKDKSGGMYIDTVLSLMIIVIIAAVMVTMYPVFAVAQELNQTARIAARVVEVTGRVGYEVEEILYHSTNMAPDSVMWDVTYYDTYARTIQLKDSFAVTLVKQVPITIMQPSFGAPIQITLTLKADASGVSEVYWK